MGRCLVEAFEDAVELVFGNAFSVVADGDADIFVIVGECYVNVSTSGSELKGIRQQVDDDFVEIVAVNPYWQLLCIALVGKLYVLGLGLLREEGIDVAYERNEFRLAHVHLHLPLVNLTQVHHLVDEAENTLCVAADGLVDAPAMDVIVLLDE